jgi:hypothetical protein
MPSQPPKGHPEHPVAAALFRQLRFCSRTDQNPFRKGSGGELVSALGARFPEAALLGSSSVPFDGEGWISGDALGLIAAAAQNRGAGLVELQPRGNLAFVFGTAPGAFPETPFRNGAKSGFRAPVSLCPFWGPCLGREGGRLELFRELFAVLAREGLEGFLTGLAGCARDCRRVIERSDLAALPDASGRALTVWTGARHRPFRPPVTPAPWRVFPAEYPGDVADFVFKVQDLHASRALRGETFPELARRLGLPRTEGLLGIREPPPPPDTQVASEAAKAPKDA